MPEKADVDGALAGRLRDRLRRWFRRHARDLPWRVEPRDPWAVLVSESMLQQTRVEVVAPRFEAFLARWPTPESMARAAEDDVVAAWKGLGYYNRARRLRLAAVALVERHEGRFPRELKALRALPGVGPYTAGAVGSLALGLPVPLVDGNVSRVLARLFEVTGDVRSGAPGRRIEALAASLAPDRDAGTWNEGLMELGALVCLPRAPRCGTCPLRGDCRARASGREGELPERPAGRPPRAVHLAAAVVRDNRGRVLLRRRPAGGVLGGQWEVPQVEVPCGASASGALGDHLLRETGTAWTVGDRLGAVRHSILDMRIRCDVHGARPRGSMTQRDDLRWTTADEREGLPASSLLGKCLRAASREGNGPGTRTAPGREPRGRRGS